MNKAKKILALVCCAALLVCISVGATLAYLYAQTEVVQNTFTVGDIELKLDEAKVDEYGNEVTGADRVTANEYKLLPGHTYVKDPTVTVNAKSEDAYVRAKVTVTYIEDLKAAFPQSDYPSFYNGDLFLLQMLVKGWDNDVWQYHVGGYEQEEVKITNAEGEEVTVHTATYEFRYVGTKNAPNGFVPYAETDTVLEDIFTHVVIPGDIDNTAIEKLDGVKIDIIAEAIQADTFKAADNKTAADAWAAFDQQLTTGA